jgi:hypothetical protein
MKEYRAVGKRIGVSFSTLDLPISPEEIRRLLRELGFNLIQFDLEDLARFHVGTSQYCLGSLMSFAPTQVDCSSFVKWLYAQVGIWLPRLSVQQLEYGKEVAFDQARSGDLIFTSRNKRSLYRTDPTFDVGHVGMVTGKSTVIHAKNSREGIIESRFLAYRYSPRFRGIRRYLPEQVNDFVTLEVPTWLDVETSDDIRWLLLKHFGKSF